VQCSLTIATTTTYYCRAYFKVGALPGAARCVVIGAGNTTPPHVNLHTDGTLYLEVGTVQQGGFSASINDGAWHRVELMCTTGAVNVTTAGELRLDGVSVSTWSGSAGANPNFNVGLNVNPGANAVLYVDDLALNDSTGTAQNSWCGEGRIVLLKPVADNARGVNWTAGGGATTNLWDAVNNTPPVGTTSPGSNTSQVRNVVSDTTGNYDAQLQSYTAAGIPGGQLVTVVHPMWNLSGTATGTGVRLMSNPVGGAESTVAVNQTAGSWPNSWLWQAPAGQIIYNPTVDFATGPVMRVGKRQASVNECSCDFMGLFAEYVPSPIFVGYVGPARTVVRGIAVAADVITPAPVLPPLSGLVVQLDASQLTGADGSAVSPWPNLATPGMPGTMISSPAPTKRNNVINGLPVVRFNTGEGRMRMTGTGVSTDFTLCAVARIHTTGAGAQRVIAADMASTGNNFLLGWWNQFQDCVFDGAWASGQPTEPATTAWRLYSFDKVGAGATRLFSNGNYLRSGGSGASNLGGSLALSGHDATTESSNCDVAEVLLYNRVLSDSERSLVEDYLRRKWTTYAAQVLSLAPRAYYRLGEPSGTQATDSSPNVRHGTYTGGVTLAQSGILLSNNAVSLDGIDDWVALPTDTISLATATSEITLEAWYKGTDTDGSILSARDTGAGNPIINFGLGQQGAGTAGTGKLNLCVRDNASVGLGNVATDYVVNDGVWHHLVATRNSAKLWTLYIDGLPNGPTLTDAMTSAVNGMDLQAIGSERKWVAGGVNVGTLQYLAGRVDEIAVYGVALTTAEILLHYRLRMSQARSYQDRIKLLEPIVYYRLNEASGTQAADYSGNNRHGTIVGTPLYGQASPFADGSKSMKLGNGAYITIPNSVSLPPGSPVTFEWWEYKATAELVASSAFEMGLPDDTTNRCQCHGPWSDGSLFWDYGNISTTGRISSAMPLDQWVLVHLIYDGIATRGIYYNGVVSLTQGSGGPPTVAKTGGDIGGANGAHTARMKDFAIYNRYIPTNEKLAHYSAASWTIAPEGIGIGRRVSTTVVKGVTLVAITPLAIGRCVAATSVKGITLVPGPVIIPIGRVAGSTIIRGVSLAVTGAAPLPIGKKLAVTVIRGVSLAATGTAPVVVGKKLAATTVRGVSIIALSQVFPITLAATVTLTPALTRKGVYFRTLAVNMTATPVLARVVKYSRTVAATTVITPVMGKLAAFGKTFAVTSVITPTLSRRLSAYRTFAASGVLSPTLTARMAAGRLLAASTTILVSMTKAAGRVKSLAASVTLAPALTYLSGRGRTLAATVFLVTGMKRTIGKGVALSLNFIPGVRRKSTMTLSVSLALNPALQVKSRFGRIIDSVMTLSAQLTKGIQKRISFTAPLTMIPNMLVGRVNKITLSVIVNFTALFNRMFNRARKPTDTLLSSDVAPAQLLSVENPDEFEVSKR
jgi:hypothetical protein